MVVEPVSLTVGAVVAALVTKAAEKGGENLTDTAGGALSRLVGWLRDRFSRDGDAAGSTVLAKVEEAPDSPSRVQALAEVVDRRAAVDPEFRRELEQLITKAAGVRVASINQTAWGNQNAQIADNQGSVTVSYGQSLPPATR